VLPACATYNGFSVLCAGYCNLSLVPGALVTISSIFCSAAFSTGDGVIGL
jgi:hypothetical protein